jgi:hypothetical protein
MTDSTPTPAIQIPQLQRVTMLVPIVSTAPLIVHRWSEKAKEQMLAAQQGNRTTAKPNRDPQADYEASLYRLATAPGDAVVYGFPVLGFKAATVGSARFFRNIKMTELRQFMFFAGDGRSDDGLQELVVILGEPKPREDMVRVGTGTDLRYRAEFTEWRTTLTVSYVATAMSQESVLSAIDAGGLGVGVGEWRPEKNGMNGTYAIDESRSLQVVGA